MIANFSSLKSTTADLSYVVEPVEHPDISRRSIVMYANATVTTADYADYLVKGEAKGLISRQAPLSEELYDKIIAGFVVATDRVPFKVLEMLRAQSLI